MRHLIIFATLVIGFSVASEAQDVRYYEQGGITYREVRSTHQQPVRDVRYQDQQETYYRQQVTTRMQDYSQLSYQPVTTYQWQPRWHDWWRIFRGPTLAYHLVPTTTWHASAHTVQVPVTQTEWVPETRTVRRAIPQLRMVEQEHVTRTALGPSANQTTASHPAAAPALSFYIPPNQAQVAIATQPAPPYGVYGGIARLDGDPPRVGTTLGAGATDRIWR